LYVTGWLKRGPSGIIGTNIADAKETVGNILYDLAQGLLNDVDKDPSEAADLKEIFRSAGSYCILYYTILYYWIKESGICLSLGARCNVISLLSFPHCLSLCLSVCPLQF